MAVDTQHLEAATAGDAEALIEVILAEGQGLRLFIAAHVEAAVVVPELEQAVWATVRRQLSRREAGVSVAEWLRWVANERLVRYLQTVDLPVGDDLIRLVVQECQAALGDARDQGAAGMIARLQALPPESRALLHQRYAAGEDLDRLAARYLASTDEVAARLVAARTSCDWRNGDHPQMGDKLLPRLMEDWFAGVLDPASRELLTAQVVRGAAQAAAIVRQARLHVMLTIAHQPFARDEATALVRHSAKSAEGREASSHRGRAVPRGSGSDPRRVQRVSSNPRMEPVRPAPPSSLPLILSAVVVLIAVAVLVMVNRGVMQVAEEPNPIVVEDDPVPPVPATPTRTPAVESVLRPQFGGSPLVGSGAAGDGPLAIGLSGDALRGTSYAGEPLRFAITVNRPEALGAVEYRVGDRLLATMTKAPFAWEWRDPTPVSGELSARALAKDGTLLTTVAAPLRILPAGVPGAILREWWGGLPGRQVADGLKSSVYPDLPNGATFEAGFAAKRDWSDQYFQRMRGYVVPPADGSYTFWISGDDEAELWLSSDETATARRRIATCPAAVAYGKWDERPQQRSAPVLLQAGRRYYIEAVHKENTGTDHVAVGWQLPDGTLERAIPGERLMPPGAPDQGTEIFTMGLEDVAVGERPSYLALDLDPAVPTATAAVVEGEAAEGRRYLALTDVPGQRVSWTPGFGRSVDFPSGLMRAGFSLRVRSGALLSYSWRQRNADKPMILGPRVTISGEGTVMVNERELTRIPVGTWVRFTVSSGLGTRADGTWTLVVQPQGGKAEEFTQLTCDPDFVRMQRWGFASSGTAGVSDIDGVTMHLRP